MNNKQNSFYKNIESNSFFERWESVNQGGSKSLRKSKNQILNKLKHVIDLEKISVLEIGCFIGDLLYHLKKDFCCEIDGVEPSLKACKYSKNIFNIDIENSTFIESKYFKNSRANFQKFDLIICDDVLSWISRDLILPTLGAIDWLLKPKGHIFLRDFTPNFPFATENHHWKGEGIYNFKQPFGHKTFFLDSGKYIETLNEGRISKEYQSKNSIRKDSMLWSDTILEKLNVNDFQHPKIDIYK